MRLVRNTVAAVALAMAIPMSPLPPQAGAQTASPQPDYHPPKKRISPFAAYADAQKGTPAALKPTPRGADGKPDLNGLWGNIPSPAGPGGIRQPGSFEPDQAVLQRGSGWDKPIYKPEYWAQVRSNDFGKIDVDPGFGCKPTGTPRQNAPAKIVQTGKEVVLIYGGLRTRIVPLDNRKLTDQDKDMSTYDGISVGRWEGDTLVVESTGFTDDTWLQWQGYFHTNTMSVTERFWRQGDLLFYNFTVNDPEVLAEPWTQGTLVRRLVPAGRVEEQEPCEVVPTGGDPYLRG